ncbi:uncharacterized protein [Rutidosis leptorrhynchoides]|uniref:uncharacterized protein n=1 Tax=Rutidosis leptorrhynchoides TaxID=125765 RepID=UPI003A999ACF
MMKVNNINILMNFQRICKEEGFDEVSIHQVGGFRLWLHFNSHEVGLGGTKRITIMRVSSNLIKQVAGRVVMFDNEKNKAMSVGRVCIATRQMQCIKEDIVDVIHVTEIEVHAHETGLLKVEMEDADADSSNSDLEAISEDKDDISDSFEETCQVY